MADRRRVWQYNAPGRVSVFDDRVYYSSTDLYALRASDGKPLWHTSQSMDLIGVTPSMVFARSADTLYALNASTGSQLWQQKMDLNYPPVSIQVAESFC